jgi:ribonucleoside-diphosphate reductase alpha chain
MTIDNNFYPTPEGKTANFKHRPVGLGTMGFHDALYELGYSFDSAEALRFADENQEFIAYHSILASSELANERGVYESYKGSKWDRGILPVDTLDLLEKERGIQIPVPRNGRLDWAPVRESIKKYGMRNSNCMAIAPTATISNIAGSSPCIEPYYKNIYVKSNMSGEFTNVNDYLVNDLKKLGLWDMEMLQDIKMAEGSVQGIARIPQLIKDKYKETFELPYKTLIDLAAYRGKWIDQSQSLNLFYKGNSGKEIADMYMYAWEMGLKTTYYLRTLAASGVEKATTTMGKKEDSKSPAATPASTQTNTPTAMPNYSVAPGATLASVETYKEVQQNINALKEATKETVLANTATDKTVLVNGKEVKICKILDPECEACQ